MNSYNLYYFYNSHHQILIDEYFLPSFKEYNKTGINLIGINFEKSINKSLFGTESFKRLGAERVSKIIDLIKNEEKDKQFIISDVDIQFFGDVYETINEIANKQYDVVFQKENKNEGVNFGFILITSNESSLNYWEKVLSVLNDPTTDVRVFDQSIGNENLNMINYTTFDESIWNWSQGDLKKHIKLHHANCVSPVEDKIKQLDLVRKFILNN